MKVNTTTELFNYFHDELKEVIEDVHWMNKFCEISGVDISTAKDCYWHNTEILDDINANRKLEEYICSLGRNCKNCDHCFGMESDAIDEYVCFCDIDRAFINYPEDTDENFCTDFEQIK